MDLFYFLIVMLVIGGIVGVCLLADGAKRRRKRQYDQDMAAWRQNEYLRQIAEQSQRQDSGA